MGWQVGPWQHFAHLSLTLLACVTLPADKSPLVSVYIFNEIICIIYVILFFLRSRCSWILVMQKKKQKTWMLLRWMYHAVLFLCFLYRALERGRFILEPCGEVSSILFSWWMRLLAGWWQGGQLQCYLTAPWHTALLKASSAGRAHHTGVFINHI